MTQGAVPARAAAQPAAEPCGRTVDVLIPLRETALRAGLAGLPTLRVVDPDGLGTFGGRVPRIALLSVGGTDPATAAALRSRHPDMAILVGLDLADAGTVGRWLLAGASAFLALNAAPQDLLAAILAHAAPDAPDRLGDAVPVEAGFGLTAREVEVLRFLGSGFSNKEVARRLDVSVRTVETHRLNLRRKTRAGRLKDLVTIARRLGLSDAEPDIVPYVHGSARRGAASPAWTR